MHKGVCASCTLISRQKLKMKPVSCQHSRKNSRIYTRLLLFRSSYSATPLLQLRHYKNVIDRLDCRFKILVCHTDYDIQLTGTLIDHLNVYIHMGKG